jgi:hypothetical protein
MLSALSTVSSMSRCSKITVPDPYLMLYITFEQMYASDKTNWVSGPYYIGNIATGSVTDLFSAGNNNMVYPDIYTVKYGLQSMRLGNTMARKSSYFLPESTGLSFCVWSRITSMDTPNTNKAIFSFYDPNTGKLFGLRMRCNTYTSGPYTINLITDQLDASLTTTYVPGNTTNSDEWNHFVWTISPALYGGTATHKIYLNNNLVYTVTLLYPANAARTFDLGANKINQNMDTFRLYKKELNSAEINNIYTNLDPNGLRQ